MTLLQSVYISIAAKVNLLAIRFYSSQKLDFLFTNDPLYA